MNSVITQYCSRATGPRYISFNEIAYHLLLHTQPHEVLNYSAICSIRHSLFKDYVWSRVGKALDYPKPQDLPLYYLYHPDQSKLLGTVEEEAHRWIDAYLTNHSIKRDASLPLGFAPWKEVRKAQLTNLDEFHHQTTLHDQKHLATYTFNQTQHILNQATSFRRLLSLDIEAFEYSQSLLTELGVAIYDIPGRNIKYHHIIIREHIKLRNKKFASDAKFSFYYGLSQKMPMVVALNWLTEQLQEANTALLGHSLHSDVNFLKRCRSKKSSLGSLNNQKLSLRRIIESIPKFDLQYLFCCKNSITRAQKLENICKELNIPIRAKLHNAGNDAALTLQAFLRLMGLEQTGR